MASATRFSFSYQRLHKVGGFDEEIGPQFPRFRIRKFNIRRRRLNLRVPGLRRFLSRRRSRLLYRVKVSCRKAWKRLKNGQAHMNDLFGGNFMVMQVSHTPFNCGDAPYNIRLRPQAYASSRLPSSISNYTVPTRIA